MNRQSGFTLLEVMVALTIFSLVAVTIVNTISMRTDSLIQMREQTLASFVVENKLAELRLETTILPIGGSKDEVSMANQEWLLAIKVEETQFPGMRKVTVSAAKEEAEDASIFSLSSFMGVKRQGQEGEG